MKRRPEPSLTVDQILQACALLGWSMRGLATRAGTANGNRSEPAIARMRAILEAAGVIFGAENGDGPGVRLRKGAGSAAELPTDAAKAGPERRRSARTQAEVYVGKALVKVDADNDEKAELSARKSKSRGPQ